jgi:cell division protein FtsB
MINKHLGFLFVIVILVTAIIFLQLQLWKGGAGILQTNALNDTIQNKTIEVDALSARNNQLYDEVISLRENNSVVEGLAREDLGLIRSDEEFYLISPVQ